MGIDRPLRKCISAGEDGIGLGWSEAGEMNSALKILLSASIEVS